VRRAVIASEGMVGPLAVPALKNLRAWRVVLRLAFFVTRVKRKPWS